MGQGAPPASWPPNQQPVAGSYYTTLPHETPQVMAYETPDTTQSVQASAEGIVLDGEGDFVAFLGEKFRLADRVGIMPLLAFANASKKGLDSDDMEGLAAMYSLIRSVIHRPPLRDEHGQRVVDENGKPLHDESEWARFEQLADDELAEGDDIMVFVNQAMEVMSARPRKPREISSGGSRPTSPKSKEGSSSPVRPPEVDGLVPVADLGR
jgi:hypothetical protein